MTLVAEAVARLAGEIQWSVPLEPDPFGRLGTTLGLDGAEVREHLRARSEDGTLREISAILEGDAFGWESALVAARVPPERLEAVAAVVNAHPTVTHDYERRHDYNLWFTLAVPPEMGLERTLEILGAEAGGIRFRPLPRTATFKIAVRFNVDSRENESDGPRPAPNFRFRPDERERRMLRALQRPLPIAERPFLPLAEAAGVTEAELLRFGSEHLGKAIRRYAATFRHRRLGVKGNAMVAWRVAGAELAAAGARLAAAPEVSHCYARRPLEDFPYALYSMVHGPDEESVRGTVARLAETIGRPEHLLLFSPREFKKCRLRYFLPELERWWTERTSTRAVASGV